MHLPALPSQDQPSSIVKVIERDWHNDIILLIQNKLPKFLAVLLIVYVLHRLVLFFVKRLRRRADHQVGNFHRAAQLRTMAAIIRATSYSVFGFIVFLQVLNLVDIRYEPLLASAGILGIAVGLGAQSIFKDMLNGVLILVEDQYNVGEIVSLAGLKGTVEDLSLGRTTVRDADGTLYIIPNSQIATVSNLSRDYAVATLNVSVDASANPDKVIACSPTSPARSATTPTSRTSQSPIPSSSASTRSKAALSPIPSRSASAPISATSFCANYAGASSSPLKKNGIPLGNDPANMLILRAPNPTAPPTQQPLIGS
jgi:moderate conductance mechanosensitive channel